ncbi:cytochrome P450 [Endozoicomonas numazuensis]|uniref:cytochrome P450 n=1 Tax=Endozoicomonas numazuensis TaxID=1137799 RepID=UPI0006917460|nr:cytochrome P450 [Endozoicomonas numazuensis]
MTTPIAESSIANLFSSNKDYLAEYDSLPDAEKYPQVLKWMKSEPLPFFAQLRTERPILVTPECTLVSHFTDVRDMLQMPKIFTVDLYKPKMGVTEKDPGYLMAHDDDALHYREKSLMQGMLNRNDLPAIRKLIAESGADILKNANNHIEIVNQYCRMVPAILVQDYFGLDEVEKESLIEWSFWNQFDVFHNQPFDLNSPEKSQHIVDKHSEVTVKLQSYMTKTMVRKLAIVKLDETKNLLLIGWRIIKGVINKLLGKKTPVAKDDIISRMLRSSFAEQVDFDLVRIGVNAGGLLIGAIETTSQAVSQVIEFILERPELLNKAKTLAADSDTKAFDDLVWEALRFVPISPYMFRQMSEDYELAKGTPHATTIKKGTNVLALTQSAMFDPYAYDQPDTFSPGRNFYHNFTFGFASHDCLGKYIGMEMIPEMVRQVMLMPGISSDGSIDYKDGPFPEQYELQWK